LNSKMSRAEECTAKVGRVRGWLAESGLRGALFGSPAWFAWITGGGRNHVAVGTERGVGAVLVTADAAYLLADNIERARLAEEEIDGLPLETREFPWWSGNLAAEAAKLVPAAELATDLPLPGTHPLGAAEALRLRNPLLPEEVERYRALGRDAAVVLTHVAFHCRPALSEHQLAGMLAGGLSDFGITPNVVLVAADERAFTRRHPLPTTRRLEKYAMLVIGGRREGLHLSATRLVHFGPIPEELRQRHLACARVEAAFLAATRPGAKIAEVFRAGKAAYAAEGWPGEWQQHHQGGPTGYAGRDLRATPECAGVVQNGQAFAWNPSIAGTKSEDTALVTDAGLEMLSETPDLPSVSVEMPDGTVLRPAILER
jgi:Xaa-Pro aminopeptidase